MYLEIINIVKDIRVTEILEIMPSPMEKHALEFEYLQNDFLKMLLF